MIIKENVQKLRVELEIVPINDENYIQEELKNRFSFFLKELIRDNLIDMNRGSSMTIVNVTPIEWSLK